MEQYHHPRGTECRTGRLNLVFDHLSSGPEPEAAPKTEVTGTTLIASQIAGYVLQKDVQDVASSFAAHDDVALSVHVGFDDKADVFRSLRRPRRLAGLAATGSGIPSCEEGTIRSVAVQMLLELMCVSGYLGDSPDNARIVEECDRRAQGSVGGALVSPEAQADALTAQATSTANLSRVLWVGAVAVSRPGSVGSVSALRSTRPTPPLWARLFDETRGLTTPERRPVDRDRLLWVWDSATAACEARRAGSGVPVGMRFSRADRWQGGRSAMVAARAGLAPRRQSTFPRLASRCRGGDAALVSGGCLDGLVGGLRRECGVRELPRWGRGSGRTRWTGPWWGDGRGPCWAGRRGIECVDGLFSVVSAISFFAI